MLKSISNLIIGFSCHCRLLLSRHKTIEPPHTELKYGLFVFCAYSNSVCIFRLMQKHYSTKVGNVLSIPRIPRLGLPILDQCQIKSKGTFLITFSKWHTYIRVGLIDTGLMLKFAKLVLQAYIIIKQILHCFSE